MLISSLIAVHLYFNPLHELMNYSSFISHLSDPSHRGMHKPTQSVVLAIFAPHTQYHRHGLIAQDNLDPSSKYDLSPNTKDDPDTQRGNTRPAGKTFRGTANFVHQMVPFYTQSWVETRPTLFLSLYACSEVHVNPPTHGMTCTPPLIRAPVKTIHPPDPIVAALLFS